MLENWVAVFLAAPGATIQFFHTLFTAIVFICNFFSRHFVDYNEKIWVSKLNNILECIIYTVYVCAHELWIETSMRVTAQLVKPAYIANLKALRFKWLCFYFFSFVCFFESSVQKQVFENIRHLRLFFFLQLIQMVGSLWWIRVSNATHYIQNSNEFV